MHRRILLSIVFLLCSDLAWATRARLASLQTGTVGSLVLTADHVMDEQMVFLYPARINSIDPVVMFEMGAPGSDAEGGILKKLNNGGRLMFYMGRDFTRPNVQGTDLRNGFLTQQNPIDITYGKDDWAVGATLSMIDNKKSKTKEQTLSLRFGKTLPKDAEFFVSADVISSAEKSTGEKMNGAPYFMGGGSMNSGDYHFFGQLQLSDTKRESAGGTTTKVKDTNILAGIEDRSLRSAGSDLFYGATLVVAQRDEEGKKISGTLLPIHLGLEHDMNSWAVLRGSVSQNFILVGTTKDETGTSTDADGISANTTVAAGLGLKYGKLQLDGTLTAGRTGLVNGGSILAAAGLLYRF